MGKIKTTAPAMKVVGQASMATAIGGKLWEPIVTMAVGACSNTPETALPEGVSADDVRALAAPAAYYANGKFGLQIIYKAVPQEWYYAGITKDKSGEPVLSETHEYAVKEVRARSEYKVSDTKTIVVGEIAVKAYADDDGE